VFVIKENTDMTANINRAIKFFEQNISDNIDNNFAFEILKKYHMLFNKRDKIPKNEVYKIGKYYSELKIYNHDNFFQYGNLNNIDEIIEEKAFSYLFLEALLFGICYGHQY
jgi:hypothetical protein